MANLFSRRILTSKLNLRTLLHSNERSILKLISPNRKRLSFSEFRKLHTSSVRLTSHTDKNPQKSNLTKEEDEEENEAVKSTRLPSFIVALTLFLMGYIKFVDCECKENVHTQNCKSLLLKYKRN